MIHCENTSCKHYFEDSCMHELTNGKNMVCISKNNECETFVAGVNDSYLKVFKMNDYEWWCSREGLEEFYTWYLKEHGLDPEDNPIEDVTECNLDDCGMWWNIENGSEEAEKIGDYLCNVDRAIFSREDKTHKVKGGIGSIKVTQDGYMKYITFREAIERNGEYTEPFCIACTEY